MPFDLTQFNKKEFNIHSFDLLKICGAKTENFQIAKTMLIRCSGLYLLTVNPWLNHH